MVDLPAQLAGRVPAVRRATSCATDRAPDSCRPDRALETDQVRDVPVQVDRVTDPVVIGQVVQEQVIDQQDLTPEIDQGESRMQVANSIDKVVKRGGQTSGGRFVRTPRDCQHSVHAFGAAIRIGVGDGPATGVIGGDGPRGRP